MTYIKGWIFLKNSECRIKKQRVKEAENQKDKNYAPGIKNIERYQKTGGLRYANSSECRKSWTPKLQKKFFQVSEVVKMMNVSGRIMATSN